MQNHVCCGIVALDCELLACLAPPAAGEPKRLWLLLFSVADRHGQRLRLVERWTWAAATITAATARL